MKAPTPLPAPRQLANADALRKTQAPLLPATSPLQAKINASPKIVAQCMKLASMTACAPASTAVVVQRAKVKFSSSSGRHARRLFRNHHEETFRKRKRRQALGRNIGTVKLVRKGAEQPDAPARVIYITTTSMKLGKTAYDFPWDKRKTKSGHKRKRAHTEPFLFHALQVGGIYKNNKIDFRKYKPMRLFSTNALCSSGNSEHNEDCEHTMRPLYEAENSSIDISYCTEYQTGGAARDEFPAKNSRRETERRKAKANKPKWKEFECSDDESEDETNEKEAMSFEFAPVLSNMTSAVKLTKL